MFQEEVFAHISGRGRLHHRQEPPSHHLAHLYCLQGTSKKRGLSQVARGSCGVLCCSSLPTSTGLHIRAIDNAVFRSRKWGGGGDDSSSYLHVCPFVELNRCLFAVLIVYGTCYSPPFLCSAPISRLNVEVVSKVNVVGETRSE